MRRRFLTAIVSAIAVLGIAAPTAASDGLPVPVEYTWENGVLSADGETRYVSMPVKGDTLLMAISADGAEVVDHTIRNGVFTIPAIALDGTSSGISHDGSTLALIKPRDRFPRQTTEFVIYETKRLRQNAERFELDGDFSFDALSPDGQTMYLIEYTDPRDPGAYQVRSFDIATRELDPDPILDSEESPDEMRGLPQTRATSPDGRWEYTLYDGGGNHPFIHALDVVEGRTVCIDLEVRPEDTTGAELTVSGDGTELQLANRRGEVLSVIDTRTYEVGVPEAEPEAAATAPTESEDSNLTAAGIAAGGLVLMAIAALGIRRMRS